MDCGFGGGGGRDLTVAKTGCSEGEAAATGVGSLPLRRSLSLGSAACADGCAPPWAPEGGGGGFCLGGGVGPPFLDVEGEDDFPELEFEEVWPLNQFFFCFLFVKNHLFAWRAKQ